MKYLHQILLVLLFSFLGELLHSLISLPIPASIYGMALLFLSLKCRVLKPQQIRGAGDFLVSFLSVLFVAPVVGLLDCWDMIRPRILPIALIVVISSALCFAVSGLVTQALIRRKKKETSHD